MAKAQRFYRAKAKRGEPLTFLEATALRFSGDECLIWPYGKTTDGYGCVWGDGKPRRASRYVCTLAHGAPPSPQHEAAHSCANRLCVNPGHIRWATTKENAADRIVHGHNSQGERHGMAKLTAAHVAEIRRLRGEITQRELSARFGISETQIGTIQLGRQWRDA